ncbi:MAG: winged helix-turn-helix domain-containing protein [Nitrososphaerales archaeon]|nr:winged helix-turn-helix domain-containing protein [Nitrososphaerales archaeon]
MEQFESMYAVQQLGEDSKRGPFLAPQDPNRKVLSRRSQLEIRMDMLKAVKEGAEKPTQIMYKANLSWVALQTHLKSLLENGLLHWAADRTRKRYELTLKGSNVMYSYAKILEEVGQASDSFFEVSRAFAY